MKHPGETPAGGSCEVCGELLESRFPDVRDPLTGERFSILRCVGCGLGHTVPRPEDPGRYYPSEYYGSRHGATERFCTRRRLRFVDTAVPGREKRRILDIGCGDGTFLLAARRAGWEVSGTERNPGPAQAAGLDVRESLDQLSPGQPFDCITMWHSFEHMPDVRATLYGVSRLLKPAGKLVLAVPDTGGLQARAFRHRWFHLDVPRHLHHFDARSLRRCLSSAGFSVVGQWHQEFEYDLFGWVQSALNCLRRRPNVFFDLLTGRRRDPGSSFPLVDLTLGAALAVLFLPAVAAGTIVGKGGTLVAVARLRI